jgi:hypothetical protein
MKKVTKKTITKSKKIKIKFYHINWDTDGEEVDLPEKVSFTVNDDFDVENDGSDLLSDEYGFLVIGYRWKKIFKP